MKTNKLTRKQQFDLIKEELDNQEKVHGITYKHTFLKNDVTEIVFTWEGEQYTWYIHLEYLINENNPNWYIIGSMLHLIRTNLITKRFANEKIKLFQMVK